MDPAMIVSARPVIRKETAILLAILIRFSGDPCETRDKGSGFGCQMSDVRIKGYLLSVVCER